MRLYNIYFIIIIIIIYEYGSISVYDSIRHDLFFDKSTNTGYFEAFGKKYSIHLNDYTIHIAHNKKLWVILSKRSPSQIKKIHNSTIAN